MTVKTQYSDEELEEFRAIINEKIAIARQSYDEMIRQLMNADSNDVDELNLKKNWLRWQIDRISLFKD